MADDVIARAEQAKCQCGPNVKPQINVIRDQPVYCSRCGCAISLDELVQECLRLQSSSKGPCVKCGGLEPGEASGAGDLCYCKPDGEELADLQVAYQREIRARHTTEAECRRLQEENAVLRRSLEMVTLQFEMPSGNTNAGTNAKIILKED